MLNNCHVSSSANCNHETDKILKKQIVCETIKMLQMNGYFLC